MSETDCASGTKLAKILNNKFSHDKLTKFLNLSNIINNNLCNSVSSIDNFKFIVNKFNNNYLIIDDTIIQKSSRKETSQAC